MASPIPLPPQVAELLEGGVSILIGSRDAGLRPAVARGLGAVLSADRREVTVYFPQGTSGRLKANLDDNGQIAVGISRPWDNLSVQLKGRCAEVREALEAERQVTLGYVTAYAEQLYLVGFPRSLVRRVHSWPAWAARFAVDDVFIQTPGPDAGKRLELA